MSRPKFARPSRKKCHPYKKSIGLVLKENESVNYIYAQNRKTLLKNGMTILVELIIIFAPFILVITLA